MSMVEIIPTINARLTAKELSQKLGQTCVVRDDISEKEVGNLENIFALKMFSIKVSEIDYHILKREESLYYMSPYEYLSDNNFFNLDINQIVAEWQKCNLTKFQVSSNSTCEYIEDIDFFNIVATLAKSLAGFISVDEYIPNLPPYLYTIDEWLKVMNTSLKTKNQGAR